MKVSDYSYNQLLRTNSKLQTVQSGTNVGKAELAMTGDDKKLMDACRGFEAIFMNELLKSMRQTVPKSELLGKSYGEDIFQSMLDEEYSNQIASTHNIGLAEIIFKQLR